MNRKSENRSNLPTTDPTTEYRKIGKSREFADHRKSENRKIGLENQKISLSRKIAENRNKFITTSGMLYIGVGA